jgi:hypothetical protein
MTKYIFRRVAVLKKRLSYLEGRIRSRENGGKATDWDRAEAGAIRFALACIELCNQNNLITSETGRREQQEL